MKCDLSARCAGLTPPGAGLAPGFTIRRGACVWLPLHPALHPNRGQLNTSGFTLVALVRGSSVSHSRPTLDLRSLTRILGQGS